MDGSRELHPAFIHRHRVVLGVTAAVLAIWLVGAAVTRYTLAADGLLRADRGRGRRRDDRHRHALGEDRAAAPRRAPSPPLAGDRGSADRRPTRSVPSRHDARRALDDPGMRPRDGAHARPRARCERDHRSRARATWVQRPRSSARVPGSRAARSRPASPRRHGRGRGADQGRDRGRGEDLRARRLRRRRDLRRCGRGVVAA